MRQLLVHKVRLLNAQTTTYKKILDQKNSFLHTYDDLNLISYYGVNNIAHLFIKKSHVVNEC